MVRLYSRGVWVRSGAFILPFSPHSWDGYTILSMAPMRILGHWLSLLQLRGGDSMPRGPVANTPPSRSIQHLKWVCHSESSGHHGPCTQHQSYTSEFCLGVGENHRIENSESLPKELTAFATKCEKVQAWGCYQKQWSLWLKGNRWENDRFIGGISRWLHSSVIILKTIELYMLNGWIV